MDCTNKGCDTFPCNIFSRITLFKSVKGKKKKKSVKGMSPLSFSVEKLFHFVENVKNNMEIFIKLVYIKYLPI